MKIKNTALLLLMQLFLGNWAFSQQMSIFGIVTDANSNETLVGCALMIQGSTIGTTTDFDGNFSFPSVAPGSYNLILSYVSYEKLIVRVDVVKGQTTVLDLKLKPSTVELEDIKVVATKRTNTELSVISSIKAGNLVASGISSQQIVKSQDKDASEVIRRVPGINIREGRFVVVRGLSERYNSVWLNNAAAPSSETDIRAFSFDMIPSNQIENLIIVKSPAPELPSDFAGGVILISTKNNAYENAVHLSYSTGYNLGTTFKDFYTYEGSSTDRLGYDNGKRSLPEGFLSTAGMKDLHETSGKTTEQIEADQAKSVSIAKSFNKIWTPSKITALPNQSLAFDMSKRFVWNNISVGNITALTYSNSNESESVNRAGYQAYDQINDTSVYLYSYHDDIYKSNVRIGGMFNWAFIFGNNQKIQFRNLLNQYGQTKTTLRLGKDYYNDFEIKTHELAYQSRTTISSQLAGDHKFLSDKLTLDWIVGYSYANKNQPDLRRVRYVKPDEETPYLLTIYNTVNPDLLGRVFMKNHEHIYTLGFNLSEKFMLAGIEPEVKTGLYTELKTREFSARNIGFIKSRSASFDYTLPFKPIDSVFMDENINYPTGITVAEATSLSDSYEAENNLIAGYIGLKIPIQKFTFYGGFRLENNRRVLTGYDDADNPVNLISDTLNIFPSINLAYNFTDKLLVRTAYGKTINRPEFREMAPYYFYDFEENAIIGGDTNLMSCYIDNFDLMLGWYPDMGDFVTLSLFYKKFKNPIEAVLTSSGTGWNYQYQNTKDAESLGLELDVRKTFSFIPATNFLTSLLHNTTLVFNTSVIDSKLTTSDEDLNRRDSVRAMQGQAPYIVNAGLYYANEKGLSVSVLYNIVGKNFYFVGDQYYAHIYQMPFSDLEVLVQKEFAEHWKIKAGMKNILDSKNTRQNIKGDKTVGNDQITREYRPGQTINLGLSYSF